MMISTFALVFCLTVVPSGAQQYKLTLDPSSTHGPLLAYVQDEQDVAKRLVILESLEAQDPKDSNYAWINDQIRRNAMAQGDTARVIAVSQKMLEYDPLDIYSAQILAEKCGDDAVKRKWAEESRRVAARVVAAKPPSDPTDASFWQARAGYARQLLDQGDYQIYKRITETADPKQRIAMAEDFLRTNPKGQYASEILKVYLNTSRELGDTARAIAAAEKILSSDPDNPGILLVLAENSQRKGDPARVVKYAGRLVELLEARPNEANRSPMLASAYWMLGNIHAQNSNHAQADRAFRAALPLVKGNAQLTGAILFHLGWANYKMGNGDEAARFNQMCLSVGSSLTSQCARNLAVVKAEFHLK